MTRTPLLLLKTGLTLLPAQVKEDTVALNPVVVTASPFIQQKDELVIPASELNGETLRRSASSTLGETLSGQPGVHSTSYGPGAGRPVIRGFDGDRIRILNQGVDSFDLSYRMTKGKVTGEVTTFFSDFSDYVYLQFLDPEAVEASYGELDTEDLNVYRATAVDAKFYGFEVDLRWHLIDEIDRAMHLDLTYDQTRATNDSFNTNLPRIPTRRLGLRYEYVTGP